MKTWRKRESWLATAVALALGVVALSASAAPSKPAPGPTVRVPAPGLRLPPIGSGIAAPEKPTAALAQLSPAQKDAVVAKMNSWRSSLGAASMQSLSWDDNLAKFAGELAEGCVVAHTTSQERMSVPGWTGQYVAENLAGATVAGLTLADATNASKVSGLLDQGLGIWWAQKPDYDLASNTCKAGKICAHYTQMVWSSTTKVGCAISMCTPQKSFGAPGYNLVCEFAPGGNQTGVRPYSLAP